MFDAFSDPFGDGGKRLGLVRWREGCAADTKLAAAREAHKATAEKLAAELRRVAAAMVTALFPAASQIVFEKDEETVSGDTVIRLLAVLRTNGEALWMNDELDDHPGWPGGAIDIDYGTRFGIEATLGEAYDTVEGGFDTHDLAHEQQPDWNVLVMPAR